MASAATASDPLSELFGTELQSASGVVPSSSLSSVELIGIYFSAHWCPPCRAFTPRLVECYNAVNANGKRFEIVFASSDQDESQYNEYFGSMPWLSLGFQSPLDAKLSSKYRVQGIPTLVFVDPTTGKTVTKDGRSAVMADLEGKEFPWTPKTFWELMGDAQIIGKSDDANCTGQQLRERLAGGYLGIYFSAHWCPPCRGFTPQLIEWYNTKKDSLGSPFDIIFVSSDRDEGSFNGYYGEMPWLALGFSQRDLKEKVSSAFGVQGIPTFAIVEVDTGNTVTTKARAGVSEAPDGFPWPPQAFGVLSQSNIEPIQETPFLLLFSEDDGSSQVSLFTAHAAAVEEKAKATGEEFEMYFMTVPKTMGLRGQLRERIMGIDEDGTKLVVLDLTTGTYTPADENDAAAVDQAKLDAFVEAYKAGSIEPVALKPPGQ